MEKEAAAADDDRVAMDRSRANSDGAHDDADQKEFNGMDVEDWLAKQHDIAERSQAGEGRGRDALKSAAGALQRKQSTPREVIDSSSSSSSTGAGFSLGDGHHQARKRSPAPSRPPPQHAPPGERKPSLKYSTSRLDEDPSDEGAGEQVLDASIRCIESTNDFYIAELTGTSQNDGLLVVDGVRTTNPKVKRMLQLSCALAAASVLAVVAGIITTRLVQEPARPAATGIPASATNDTGLGARPQNYSTTTSIQGNLNWTIAEAAISAESKGLFPTAMFLSPSSREIFFEKFNRTDANFTGFTVKSGGIQIFDGLDISLLSKMLTDPWIGHVMDYLESLFVEGKVVAVEDLYEGMVLTSISGYPIEIQLNPLRVNNVSVSTTQYNQFYINGVVHNLLQYADPLMPWIGKSLFDVLVETNEKRHGDLSVIIDLIQESQDDVKNLLELRAGDTSATTLFAPTNAAMGAMNLTALALDETTLFTFLENHLVSNNFARRFWRYMPISAGASDSGLAMTTQAGQVLDVKINDTTVTINGNVTIVQGDIFSEQGIMHVIDNPLSFLSWDVFGGRS